jgi:ABC-type nitrate/sulfonate/bicarbonate transport system substrate-binding protein
MVDRTRPTALSLGEESHMLGIHPGRRWLRAIGCAVIVVSAITVSGASARTHAGATPQKTKALLPLTVVIGQYTPLYADLFIARYEGFFKKAGVNVLIENGGSSFATVELSGRADLALCGASCVFPFASQGKDVRIVYATGHGDREGYMVQANSPVQKATDLSGARLGSFQVGLSKGVASALSNYIVSKGGKPLKLTAVTTTTGDFDALVAEGVIDVALSNPASAQTYLSAHKLKWVSDLMPGSTLMKQFFPDNVVGISAWGLSDTLKQKQPAIIRFIAGLRMAERFLLKNKTSTVATALHAGIEGFNQEDPALVLTAVNTSKPVWNTTKAGYVTAADWATSLKTWANWGTGLDLTKPLYGYQARVDMSYWNAATKLVNTLSPKKQ